jgi:hypothetical protein
MSHLPFEKWQQDLITRLEMGIGRALVPADHDCLVWNLSARTLTVESRPLLGEIRSNAMISNVFRAPNQRSWTN